MLKNIFILVIFINLICLVVLGYNGTVTIQYGDDVIIDCNMTYSPYCYGDYEIAAITYYESNGRWERYYVRIPIPPFLYGSVIDSAAFKVYKTEIPLTSTQDFTLSLNKLLEELTEYYEATVGNIYAPIHDPINSDTSATYAYDYLGWINFDITELARGWLNFTSPNNGFVVKMLHEAPPTYQIIIVAQSLFPDSTKWPILELSGSSLPDTFITSAGITKIDDRQIKERPHIFSLSNYPNPFNPITNIKFDLHKASAVTLRIYDINGRLISTLLEKELTPGSYKIKFDGEDLASGIYFCRITSGNYIFTKKILFSR